MPFTGWHPLTNLPYKPRVADLEDFANPRHTRLASQAWNANQDRPKFYESTINDVFARTPQTMWPDPEGRNRLLYKCAETGEWGPYDAFDIDHEVKWNDFLRAVRPATRADASIAYNDLSNLRAVMSGANRAGDYNRDDIYSDDEEEDDDDRSDVGSDGDIRDLIDDDEAEDEMPAEARAGLDDYVRQQRDPANRIRSEDIEAGRRRPREPDIEPPGEEDDDDAAADLADDARSGPRRKRQRLRAEQDDDADAADADAAADAADAAGSASARGAQAARGASAAADAGEAGEAADALGALEEIGELALVALL